MADTINDSIKRKRFPSKNDSNGSAKVERDLPNIAGYDIQTRIDPNPDIR